ncbi:hypothetical protein BJX99DRAFT_237323 [Aspergillus californicus]
MSSVACRLRDHLTMFMSSINQVETHYAIFLSELKLKLPLHHLNKELTKDSVPYHSAARVLSQSIQYESTTNRSNPLYIMLSRADITVLKNRIVNAPKPKPKPKLRHSAYPTKHKKVPQRRNHNPETTSYLSIRLNAYHPCRE